MQFNKLKDIVVTNKVVFVRCDFNVPIFDGKIIDDTRIIEALPTINYLCNNNAKVIIGTHLGRPKGVRSADASVAIVAEALNAIVKKKVYFVNECIGEKVKNAINIMKYGEILFLENLRFYKEEENFDLSFSKQLCEGINIYVNEAFSCSHRVHSSIFGMPLFIRPCAGFRFEKEVEFLSNVFREIPTPSMAIVGGSKISTKIGVLKNLAKKLNYIVPAGGILNSFLKAKNFEIGKSIYEKDSLKIVEEILQVAKENNCQIVLPKKVVVAKNQNDPNFSSKEISAINQDDMILDMDYEFIEKDLNDIISKCKLCIWNGPVGLFEIKPFDKGSSILAKIIIEKTKNNGLISIAGGGDVIAAISKNNNPEGFSFISTAGGAFLEFLEGKILPGIEILKKLYDPK